MLILILDNDVFIWLHTWDYCDQGGFVTATSVYCKVQKMQHSKTDSDHGWNIRLFFDNKVKLHPYYFSTIKGSHSPNRCALFSPVLGVSAAHGRNTLI